MQSRKNALDKFHLVTCVATAIVVVVIVVVVTIVMIIIVHTIAIIIGGGWVDPYRRDLYQS